ncbi:type I-C CRISPR-associated protein Cas8c/Csd1, partial [Candidatus Poribacteria bacterium]|nr:type I-C CRISPR-associated protein Cas8c/Csd1 [Candidatus Poribacteria bacterium]
VIHVALDGRYLGLESATSADGAPMQRIAPYCRRSGTAPPPCLLADRVIYTLGVTSTGLLSDAAAPRHAAYATLVRQCAAQTGDARVRAVAAFLRSQVEEARAGLPAELCVGDTILFRVGKTFPTDLPAVQEFWQEMQATKLVRSGAVVADCVVCGTEGPAVRRMPVELRLGRERVQMISADKGAYESYGLKASETAPTCPDCAVKHGHAADYLMTSPDHRYRLGDLAFLFWTASGASPDILQHVWDPQRHAAAHLSSGGPDPPLPTGRTDRLHIAAVTTNTSRLVVRDWIETGFTPATKALREYFRLQELASVEDGHPKPLSLYALSAAAAPAGGDISASIPVAILRCAVLGEPLPLSLVRHALRRARSDVEFRITYPRAVLIKMTLNSQARKEEAKMTPSLDRGSGHPAYNYGRLLCVLDEVQRRTLGAMSATMADRCFATASTAPGAVFPRLLRATQYHLADLRRRSPGASRALQREIAGIVNAVPAPFRTTLTLEEQGMFAIGYYHQRADNAEGFRDRTAPASDIAAGGG